MDDAGDEQTEWSGYRCCLFNVAKRELSSKVNITVYRFVHDLTLRLWSQEQVQKRQLIKTVFSAGRLSSALEIG